MTKDILVRSVPGPLIDWIDAQRAARNLTQNEAILEALEMARSEGSGLLLRESLFEYAVRRNSAASLPDRVPFKFIDLFAGIGGMRIGMEQVGGTCVFTSEWDKYSAKRYAAWFGEKPHGDITEIDPKTIPDHDVLCAGFPCQPFSIAGVSKKKSLGREHGFKDATQGTLFFHLASIAEVKRPPVLLLENVKNLISHDKGRTWEVIRSTLEELDYIVFHRIIDAAGYVPQHRERVFIVAFDRRVFGDEVPFDFPKPPEGPRPRLADILDPRVDRARYTLSNHLWGYLQAYAKKHAAAGNGFGFGLADPDGVTRTLSARYYKDGSEILVPQERANPRRLTPREAARLMGYPDSKPIVVSDTQAYKQFGNSVVPAVVAAVGRQIVRVLAWQFARNGVCLLKKPAPH